MDCIDDSFGVITKNYIKKVSEVQKGYTNFQDGDVLFAKITPCMENGKCSIAKNLKNDIGFGSTEFHVLRTSNLVIPEWIFYYLRQEKIRQKAERNMTGSAGQKRVPTRFLADLDIPLPPLEEQKRIAKIAGKCDRIRRTRCYTQQLSDTYLQSAFLEMFGDLSTNLKGWEVKDLSEVVHQDTIITYGIVQAGPNIEGGIPYIRTGDIKDGKIVEANLLRTEPSIAAQFSRSEVHTDDLVMSIRATVGTVAKIFSSLDGSNLTQGTAKISPGHLIKGDYLLLFIRSSGCQKWIQKQVKGATFREITLQRLREMPVMLPPMSLQEKFAQIVQRYDRLRAQQRESDRQAEHLFQTVLHRAFSGEL
jgi:type I restriction enzyme, S subunit